MRKKTVTITLDPDVWLAFQTQVDDRQRSGTINNLLRNYLIVNLPEKTQLELRNRLEELNKKREGILEEVTTITTQLATLQNEEAKKRKTAEDWATMVSKSQVRSPWEDVENG